MELATCSWADWFNTNRLHSSIGYATPMEYEEAFRAAPAELDLEPASIEDNYHHADPHEHQLAG